MCNSVVECRRSSFITSQKAMNSQNNYSGGKNFYCQHQYCKNSRNNHRAKRKNSEFSNNCSLLKSKRKMDENMTKGRRGHSWKNAERESSNNSRSSINLSVANNNDRPSTSRILNKKPSTPSSPMSTLSPSTSTTISTNLFLFNYAQSLIYFSFFLLLMIKLTSCEDVFWEKNCSLCHCSWHDGKRNADCRNRTFTAIPQNLSSSIQVLELSNNFIPEIHREEFADVKLENLHKLFMRNCTLEELNRDSLKGLGVLIELDLSNNLLRRLYPGTFSGLVKLRKVIVNNNRIELLENNLFRDLIQLHILEFKNNHIKRVEINTFVNLPVLTTIYLDFNQLTTLRKECFMNLSKLIELSLRQNPWNCTCELADFHNFIIKTNLYKQDTFCSEPMQLRNKVWTEISDDYFACRPKIISPRNGQVIQAKSENVTLQCKIRGTPKPNILWLFNKKPVNFNDQRINVRNTVEQVTLQQRHSIVDLFVSELTIHSLKANDKGPYMCITENHGGKDESEIQLSIDFDQLLGGGKGDSSAASSTNVLLLICIILIAFLIFVTCISFVICWYCRRRYMKNNSKETTMSESGLITSKLHDKTQNGSILEGSVIMEMQKKLLTEVNPVEKPPRRTDIETVDTPTDDGHEMKKTLLDETPFGNHDEETHSVALSDTTPRSRQTFVEDGYGANLPPDLLAFPARVPPSPSLQSSMSNIPDARLYGKSPLASPIYQHVNPNGIYGTTPAAFRTLQHPKPRNLALAAATASGNGRTQSPFIPAPVVYPQVVMKQGYMTIPRKPRVPSWTPSATSALSEFQSPPSITPSNGTGTTTAGTISPTGIDIPEPVYDNLGLRTTAGGNSLLNLHKLGNNVSSSNNSNTQQQLSNKYTMKNRPLPATPNTTTTGTLNMNNFNNYNTNGFVASSGEMINSPGGNLNMTAGKIYEPIHEIAATNSTRTSDTEPLYGTAKGGSNLTIVPSLTALNGNASRQTDKIVKIPPRPPPKPKKKIAVTSTGQGGSTSQLFEDEGEDGTEV